MQPETNWLQRWEEIVEQADKDHIPLECVKKIIFRSRAGSQKTINLRKLRDQALTVDEISAVVDRYVQENADSIINMEFILDVQAVADLLQPETDKLLRGM